MCPLRGEGAMTTPTTPPVDLQAIEARCEAATEGPWDVGNGTKLEPETSIYCDDALGTRIADAHNSYTATSHEQEKRNATFIAHARTDIPALLSLIREKDQVIERLEAEKKRTADVLSLEGFADAATAIIEYQYVKTQLDDLKAGQEAREADGWRWGVKSVMNLFAGEADRYLFKDDIAATLQALLDNPQEFASQTSVPDATHSGEKMK
jgi:hypothetical protein